MDFEKIKYHWESSFKKDELLDNKQLAALLKIKKSSNTALKKLVRNHRFGLIISSAMYGILITGILLFIETPASIIWIGMVTILMATVFYFSGRSYNRIRKIQISDEQLKPALEKTIKEVSRNLKFGMGNLYKFVLIPLALILGIAIGIYIASGDTGFWHTVQSLENKSIIKIILVITVGSGITIPYSQFVMKRMYKQHVDELKRCLKEFDEEIENH
jgi:hypothetical protein